MAQKTKAQLNTAILAVLEDDGTIFTDTSTAQAEAVREYSLYDPWRSTRVLTLRDKSRNIDISGLELVNPPDYAIYPVLLKDSGVWLDDEDLDDNRKNVEWEADSVRMRIRTVPQAEKTDTLTGTVTFSDGSTAVSGSGTLFTSELRVGWYIRKSGQSTWYRIGSITDATNLVLAKACITADDGADTADLTEFWNTNVYLKCDEIHHVTSQVDLAGAIDAGAAAGYAAGVNAINVDALTTDQVVEKNTLLTIAGCDGVYRVTADVTVADSQATMSIEPCLKEIAPENAVVTFRPSSLKPQAERLIANLAAAHIGMNWVGLGRSEVKLAIAAALLVNSTVDSVSARITVLTTASTGVLAKMLAAVTANSTAVTTQIGDAEDELDSAATACQAIDDAIGDYTTTADKAAQDLVDSLAQLDFAVTAIGVIKAAIAAEDSDIDTAIADIKTQLDNAVTDLTTDIDAVLNTITVAPNVESTLINKAVGEINVARGRIAEAEALKNPNSQYGVEAMHELNLAITQIRHALALIQLEGAITSENALSVRSYVTTAAGYVREALAYANFDAQQVASYARTVASELRTIDGYLKQASGYARQIDSDLKISNIILSYQRWGQSLYNVTIAELRKMQKSKRYKEYPE